MNEIGKDFVDGMYDIYSVIYTEDISIYLLDENLTIPNLYKESKDKVYQTPISLLGHVVANPPKDSNVQVIDVEYSIFFMFPTKELDLKKVPRTTKDLTNSLKKARIVFNNNNYRVTFVEPMTYIGGEYLIYKFYCLEENKKSGVV